MIFKSLIRQVTNAEHSRVALEQGGHAGFGHPVDCTCDNILMNEFSRLARVNGAFFGGSIPFIWKHMRDLQPLIPLLPEPTRVDTEVSRRESASSEWKRFQLYSSQIECLTFEDSELETFGPQYRSIFLQYSRAKEFFPKLKSINLSSTHVLPQFLASLPQLHHIDFDFSQDGPEEQVYITTTTRCLVGKQLGSLLVKLSLSQQPISNISKLTNLKLLHIKIGSSLRADDLSLLSLLPKLTDLTIEHVDDQHIFPLVVHNVAQKSFPARPCTQPSLKSLTIQGDGYAQHLIACSISPGNLTSLHLRVTHTARYPDRIFSLYHALRFHAIRNTQLEELEVSCHKMELVDKVVMDGIRQRTVVDANIFLAPLSKLTMLKRLHWDSAPAIDLFLVQKICDNLRHLKNLEDLWLDVGPFGRREANSYYPPLQCLENLCRYNTELKLARVLVDLSQIPTTPPRIQPGSKLRMLYIESNVFMTSDHSDRSMAMAEYLDTLFPVLESLSSHEETLLEMAGYNTQVWHEVRKLLAMYQGDRKKALICGPSSDSESDSDDEETSG
ncbi:hypothetical protein FA15DRAFT_644201 [Coprinopsis marcescibilis]|uniref:F-box domain-containing protein n=1 Tax=Coprinopsis marcescibilis TaxID=230819 RepID=A0A5C3KQL9_COPMA|nr:hypothetical protein FA15DRAFT_644201 [Coprinopsis marcescibilis]